LKAQPPPARHVTQELENAEIRAAAHQRQCDDHLAQPSLDDLYLEQHRIVGSAGNDRVIQSTTRLPRNSRQSTIAALDFHGFRETAPEIRTINRVRVKPQWILGRVCRRIHPIRSGGPAEGRASAAASFSELTVLQLTAPAPGYIAMSKCMHLLLLTASLLALPMAGAMAQDSSGRGSASTAAPHSGGTSATARGRVPADANPHLPGATGDDIVRGDRSTIAGDRAATLDRRDGAE
jgi:hypothetical protein